MNTSMSMHYKRSPRRVKPVWIEDAPVGRNDDDESLGICRLPWILTLVRRKLQLIYREFRFKLGW